MGELRGRVRSRADLLAAGMSTSDVERAVTSAALRRIHRNQYVDHALWDELWPESRHRAEVVAAVAEMRGGAGVVSHASAAVVHDIPLYRHRPTHVETTIAADVRSRTAGGVRRHRDRIDAADIAVVDGIRCTTLDRTVFDIARTLPAETALACADAALRRHAMIDRFRHDESAAADWRAAMLERARQAAGRRGVRRARATIESADGRADRPGESVARLQLVRLGFAPRVQVPVAAPGSGNYWVDFALDGVDTFVEFDGDGKYLDEALRRGILLEQVVLEEKRREDWIRGTTGWRVVRISAEHTASPAALTARLDAFRVAVPVRW